MKIPHLIVDSSAFIKNAQIHEVCEKVYSVPGILNEVKDRQTRRRLAVLPYELIMQEPSKDSMKFVYEFAIKTGDYRNLSPVDLRIIALTYEKFIEVKGSESLRSEPEPPKIMKARNFTDRSVLPGFHISNHKNKKASQSSDSDHKLKTEVSALIASMIDSCVSGEFNGADISETKDPVVSSPKENKENSDDEDWITPENIKIINLKMKEHLSLKTAEEQVEVACMTTDFAMQNVLKRIGIPVVSVDGLMIKEARSYVLYCHCCHSVITNLTVKACPKCGLDDLLQKIVAKSLKSGKIVYIMPKKPFVNRKQHTFYVPPLKGGRKGTNHAANSAKSVQRRKEKKVTDMLDVDFILSQSPFIQDDLRLRGKRTRRR